MMHAAPVTHTPTYFHQPWEQEKAAPFIDQSLAKAVARSYAKELLSEWDHYEQRTRRSIGRNDTPNRKVKNHRQLRERQSLLDKLLGNLIPVSSAFINGNSKCASVSLGLRPDRSIQSPHAHYSLQVYAWVLLMPGFLQEIEIPMRISLHAVERVIQRSGLVDLPIRKADMQAINAEFADMLPLAALAIDVMKHYANQTSDEQAHTLTLLLPSAHGLFVGNWCPELGSLLIKTFIDAKKFNSAQTQAVHELKAVTDIDLAPVLVDALIPRWFQTNKALAYDKITQAWQHFAWRFDIDRLHPGMSDAAWQQSN